MTAEVIVSARLKVGESSTFAVCGHTFDVRRISQKEYSLGTTKEKRRRYGRLEEIRADVRVVLDCGSLPARIDSAF